MLQYRRNLELSLLAKTKKNKYSSVKNRVTSPVKQPRVLTSPVKQPRVLTSPVKQPRVLPKAIIIPSAISTPLIQSSYDTIKKSSKKNSPPKDNIVLKVKSISPPPPPYKSNSSVTTPKLPPTSYNSINKIENIISPPPPYEYNNIYEDNTIVEMEPDDDNTSIIPAADADTIPDTNTNLLSMNNIEDMDSRSSSSNAEK